MVRLTLHILSFHISRSRSNDTFYLSIFIALSQRNDEAANVLEKFGADRSEDLRKLIEMEIKEEEMRNSTVNGGKLETHVENKLDLSSSDRDAEHIDALLMKAVKSFR